MIEPGAPASARELEALAMDAAARGALVLTPTSRLGKRYRHAHRMRMRGAGQPLSWNTPDIASFRRWVRACYDLLWEGARPADKGSQMALWAQATDEERSAGSHPPPGIEPSPALFSRLQDALDRLRQVGIEAAPEGTVSEWRAKVTLRFEGLARARGLVLWHEIQEAVRRGIAEGRVPLPASAVVILNELPVPGPLGRFLETMASRCELSVLEPPGLPALPGPPACRVFADPEQECRGVCAEAVERWSGTGGAEALAIVPLDESYFPVLERCLDELAGRSPLRGKDEIRYNLAWGPPLVEHPLFLAAVLPLRMDTLPDPVRALAALLRSPYADPGRFEGLEKVLSRLWDSEERIPLSQALRAVTGSFPSLSPLRRFLPGSRAPISEWIERLEQVWKATGFPWKAGSGAVRDQNATAEKQLTEALAELKERCGGMEADGAGALAWIRAMCANQRVTEPTAETAGIQVLRASDAFALPFDRLWVVGAHGEALPRARPPEPLLSPRESLAFSGGDHQRRSWQDGVRTLGGLVALCPQPSACSFTRAKSEDGGERPRVGSPLLEDRFRRGGEGTAWVFDVWGAERDRWLAAPWLLGASEGLAEPAMPARPAPDAVPLPLSSPLWVTGLDALLKCPFRYFASAKLALQPLPEPREGVSPAERGSLVHDILDGFTAELEATVPEWPSDEGRAWDLLRGAAEDRLAHREGAHWSAERTRLLGEDEQGSRGLLKAWLEAERERALEGWRPEVREGRTERPFRGLRLEGVPVEVEGRADRVDRLADGERLVWDYKTGTAPTASQVLLEKTEAQLPAYLLALRQGLLDRDDEGNPVPWEGPASAGYIGLKKAGKIEIRPLDTEGRDGVPGRFLAEWQEQVARRLREPLGGLYRADPRKAASVPDEQGTACAYCPFPAICGYFDAPGVAPEDGDGWEEE